MALAIFAIVLVTGPSGKTNGFLRNSAPLANSSKPLANLSKGLASSSKSLRQESGLPFLAVLLCVWGCLGLASGLFVIGTPPLISHFELFHLIYPKFLFFFKRFLVLRNPG